MLALKLNAEHYKNFKVAINNLQGGDPTFQTTLQALSKAKGPHQHKNQKSSSPSNGNNNTIQH